MLNLGEICVYFRSRNRCVCGLDVTPGPDISHLITGCFVRCIQSQFCLKYIRYKTCMPHLYTIFLFIYWEIMFLDWCPNDQLLWSCTIFISSTANCIITKSKQIRKRFLITFVSNCVCKCCLFFMRFIIHCGFAIWRRCKCISVESSFMTVFYW